MKLDMESLKAARLKLRQLNSEVLESRSHADLTHTLSKLALFLRDAVGDDAWEQSRPVEHCS